MPPITKQMQAMAKLHHQYLWRIRIDFEQWRGDETWLPTWYLAQNNYRGTAFGDLIQLRSTERPGEPVVKGLGGNDYIIDGKSDHIGYIFNRDLIYGDAGPINIGIEEGGERKLSGGSGSDFIVAGAGDDTVYAGTGNDWIAGDGITIRYFPSSQYGKWVWRWPEIKFKEDPIGEPALPRIIIYRPGDDKLYGGPGDDFIHGGGGDDLVQGGPGDDILIGGKGDDAIVPKSGQDVLYGGAGEDIFDLTVEGTTGVKWILDFNPNEDTLKLPSADIVNREGVSYFESKLPDIEEFFEWHPNDFLHGRYGLEDLMLDLDGGVSVVLIGLDPDEGTIQNVNGDYVFIA